MYVCIFVIAEWASAGPTVGTGRSSKKNHVKKKKTRASKKITGGVKGAKAQQQAQCSFFIAPVEKNEKIIQKKVCHFLPTQNDNVYAGEETELSFFCTRLFVFYVMQKKNNSFC